MSYDPIRPVEKVEVMEATDDVGAFIKSESGGSFEQFSEQAPEPINPQTRIAERKARKDRNRRASVNLREDVRTILEGLGYYPLESANLQDRPGPAFDTLVFNKYGVATNQRQVMNNLDASQLWRACARHYLLSNEEKEGSKGRRGGEEAFDEFRHTPMGNVNSKLCICMFRDIVEIQWNLRWGAFGRQCVGKNENQDGWCVVAPHGKLSDGRFLSDQQKKDTPSPTNTGPVLPYSGLTNFHAEEVCRAHSVSVSIPSADVTAIGESIGLDEALIIHSKGGACYLAVDQQSPSVSKKTRRASLLKKIKGHDVKKVAKAETPLHVEPVLNISADRLTPKTWSTQANHGPLSHDEPTPPTFHSDWRTSDSGANFPSYLRDYNGKLVEDPALLNHPGTKVNPFQPAVLIAMDGHGSGGKLGVARAATSMAESMTVALSNISWLATSCGFDTKTSSNAVYEAAYANRDMGIQDTNCGGPEELVYEKLGSNLHLKGSLCSCQVDHQLLQHATSYVADRSVIRTSADSDDRLYDKMTDQESSPTRKRTTDTKIFAMKRSVLESSRQLVINLLSTTFRLAHSRILSENDCLSKDFGATCTAMVVAGRYLFAAWVGDSPGTLIAIKGNKFGAIRLTHEHDLKNFYEKRRIEDFKGPNELDEKDTKRRARRNSRGHIIQTQTAGSRLIPSHIPYMESRNQGLSINMSRALGHNQLTYCALSPQPEFATVDILYALPRMKWCTGPKAGEPTVSSDSNRSFLNANTHTSINMGQETLEECSATFHLKPNQAEIKGYTACESPYRTVPSLEMVNAFKDLELYVCAYSDGVGDCMNPCAVGAEIFANKDRTCLQLAGHLTARAEQVRSMTGFLGKDNCAVVVSRMTLDSVIPVVPE